MSERYWKRRLKRALADTIGPLGWNLQTVVFAIEGTAVFLLALWALSGFETVRGEVDVVIATVAALVVVFVGNFLLNYVAAPSRMQREADQEVGKLQASLDRIGNKQDAVDALSDLLSDGISEIWNRPITSDQYLDLLSIYWNQWTARVEDQLKENFTHADLIHFSRLGVVPLTGRDGTYDRRHEKILREYALKEQRLREIIRDHNVTRI